MHVTLALRRTSIDVFVAKLLPALHPFTGAPIFTGKKRPPPLVFERASKVYPLRFTKYRLRDV
eukprot:5930194-Pleurochrysis_carterae.AAC.1